MVHVCVSDFCSTDSCSRLSTSTPMDDEDAAAYLAPQPGNPLRALALRPGQTRIGRIDLKVRERGRAALAAFAQHCSPNGSAINSMSRWTMLLRPL